jgi:hypothetical protein
VSPTRRKSRRKTWTLLTVALVVVAVAGAAYFLAWRTPTDSAPASASGAAASSAGGGASTEGAAATSSAPYTVKPEPTTVATDKPTKPTGGRVDVVLTYAGFDAPSGTVQANGFAAGVLEDGGTCTLTLSRSGEQITVTSAASADASTTTCGLLETDPGVGPGTWDAVLAYSSDDAQGTSQSMQVVVP